MEIQLKKLQPHESISYREIRLECLKNFPKNFGSNYQDEKTKAKLFFQPYIEQLNLNIDNHITEKEKCNVYALYKFFVEVVYDDEQNVITELRSFKTGHILDKYSIDF